MSLHAHTTPRHAPQEAVAPHEVTFVHPLQDGIDITTSAGRASIVDALVQRVDVNDMLHTVARLLASRELPATATLARARALGLSEAADGAGLCAVGDLASDVCDEIVKPDLEFINEDDEEDASEVEL